MKSTQRIERTNATEPVYSMAYKASPTGKLFHLCNSFVKGIMGPVGSGKSVSCCLEIFLKAKEMTPCRDGIRRSRWLVVRNTLPQLETTTIKTWLDWFPERIFGNMSRKPPYTHNIKYSDVELEVIFLALDKDEDVKKLLSLECTGIWFNEAREINKAIVDAGTMRVGRYPSKKDKPEHVKDEDFPNWYGVIMDTNPPDDTHWWYRCAEEESWATNERGEKIDKNKIDKNMWWNFFRQPSGLKENAENIENLPKGYYQRLMSGKDKEWINVYVCGNYGFIKDGKAVFGLYYNDDIHSIDKIDYNPNAPLYGGLDFGLTPTLVLGQRTARGGWNIIDEIVTDDMGIKDFGLLIKQELSKYNVPDIFLYGDPSGAYRSDTDNSTAFEVLRGVGIKSRPAQTNNLNARLECVKGVLSRMIEGKPAFKLSRKCKILRRGFNGGYKYSKISSSQEDRYCPEPDKNSFSHPQDSLQYLLMGGGEYKEIKNRKEKFDKPIILSSSWRING